MSFNPNALPSTAWAYIDEIIQLWGGEGNPFLIADQVILSEFYPNLPNHVFIQLRVISGLYGIALLLNVATSIVRYRRGGSLALFRLIPTSRGSFIAPQTANTWGLFTAIYLILAQPAIYYNIRIYSSKGPQKHMIVWRMLTFLSLWITFALECWGMSVALVLTKQQQQLRSVVFRPRIPPIILNVFYSALAICIPAALIVLVILADLRYNETFQLYGTIRVEIAASAATYNGTFDFEALQPLIDISTRFLTSFSRFVPVFRVSLIIFVGSAAFLLANYTTISTMYIWTLRKEICLRLQTQPQTYNSEKSEPPPDAGLVSQYRNLIACATTTLICGLIYIGVALMVLFQVELAKQEITLFVLQLLLEFWVFCVFGTTVQLLMFMRVLGSKNPSQRNNAMQMTPPEAPTSIGWRESVKTDISPAPSTSALSGEALSFEDILKTKPMTSPKQPYLAPQPVSITVPPTARSNASKVEGTQDFDWLSWNESGADRIEEDSYPFASYSPRR